MVVVVVKIVVVVVIAVNSAYRNVTLDSRRTSSI